MHLDQGSRATSSNLSKVGFWFEESVGDSRAPGSFLPAIAAQTAHTKFELVVENSFDIAVHVGFPESSPLRFKHPTLMLHVSDADQDGVFVATDTFSRVYGEGHDPEMAIGDYVESLLARFVDFEDHEDTLAPGLRRELASMRRYIARAK